MDVEIGKAIVKGFVYGLALSIIVAMVTIPASYVANRYIYHSSWMRVLMIMVAGVGSVFLFMTMLVGKFFGLKVVNYLGCFPLMVTTGSGVLDYILEPILQVDQDVERIAENFNDLLIPIAEPQLAVNEALIQQAQEQAMRGQQPVE